MIIHRLLNPEIQKNAQKYETEKRLSGFVSSLISIVHMAAFYFSGVIIALSLTL